MSLSPLFSAASLQEALARVHACAGARRVALISRSSSGQRRELTYGALFDASARIAARLVRAGVAAGDRVLVASADDEVVLGATWACLEQGFCAAVVYPGSSERECRHYVDLARPAGAVVDDGPLAALLSTLVGSVLVAARPTPGTGSVWSKLLGNTSARATASGLAGLVAGVDPAEPPPSALLDDGDAYVLFTSGSTSRPKGVRISRGALRLHAGTLSRVYGYGPDCRIACTLPLHHTDGLMHGALTAWLNSGAALRPEPFSLADAPALLDAIYGLRATHFVSVPTQLHLLERFAVDREDSFRGDGFSCVISSAAPLDAALWDRFERRFGVRVANLYGLTETVCGALYCGPGDETYRRGTVGRPVDCEARIVDEAGRHVAPGSVGELWLKGPHITPMYLGGDGADERVMSADGWLATGDLASVDADGCHLINGRKKNLVISAGVNIQPEEVSEVMASMPGVREAVAFGVDDEAFGEVLVACVAIEPGGPGEAAILAHCAAQLASFKVPRALVTLPMLPRGQTGKVAVAQARELFARKRSREALPRGGDTEQVVLEVVARTFHVPPEAISPASGPDDIPQWDSFGHLELMLELEVQFGISLTTRDILSLKTVSDAQRLVRVKTAA